MAHPLPNQLGRSGISALKLQSHRKTPMMIKSILGLRSLALMLAVVLGTSITLTSCDTLEQVLSTATTTGVLSNEEIALGLKDALQQGAVRGADVVSVVNGYFGNELIKLALPEEAQPIIKALQLIPGGQKLLDDATLAINRAAEEAANEAAPVFVDAITSMTIPEALDILMGGQDAATRYLDRTTSPELTRKFTPIIDRALDNTNATKYWKDVMDRYNKIPFVQSVNPDLSEHVTEKALGGLFVMVALEENKIRGNISARTTPTMKKVFAYYDQNK